MSEPADYGVKWATYPWTMATDIPPRTCSECRFYGRGRDVFAGECCCEERPVAVLPHRPACKRGEKWIPFEAVKP